MRSDCGVLAKVLAPERGPIQQALDFGADVVVIPHVENVAHAADKPWVLPAWAQAEKEFALVHGADEVVLLADHAALVAGFGAALSETRALAERLPVDTKS